MKSALVYQSRHYKSMGSVSSNPRFKKILSLIDSEQKGKVLDVGCLDGSFSVKLLEKGFDVHGCDFSPLIEKAIQKGIKCKRFDLEKRFPFKDNFFDGVIAGEVIEHLFNTTHFLREVNRVLKPNGFLVLTTPNTAALYNRLLLVFGKKPLNLDFDAGGGHIRAYTLSLLEKQLKENGFTIEKKTADLLRLSSRIENPLIQKIEFFLAGLFPSLSMNLIVKARKKGMIS